MRPLRPLAVVAVPVALSLVLGGCEVPTFGIPRPVNEQGERTFSLWQGSMVTAIAVAALVWGLIAWAVLRYRRRDDELPGQSPDNLPLEVLYTAVPLAIVAVLFGFTMFTQQKVVATTDDPDVVVDVVGFQWQWQFRYPADDILITGTYDEPPEMVVPVGRTVRLRLDANDVVHSFWVPRFLAKRDLIPGVRNEIDVDITEEGEWIGRCAEFCGLDHYKMNFSVRAVPEDEFEEWLDDQRGAGG